MASNSKHKESKVIPLIIASSHGHYDTVIVLLERGCDVNIQDSNGQTPLHHALNNNHLKVAKLLVDNGADINLKDKKSESSLLIAIKNGLSSFIIESGVIKDYSYLVSDLVKIWRLDKGGNTDIIIIDNISDIINFIIMNDWFDFLKLLIKEGFDINIKDQEEKTPLHIAVTHERIKYLPFLIKNGANCYLTDKNNDSPFDVAIKSKNIKLIKSFVDIYPDIITNNTGKSFLISAISTQDISIINYLTEKGENVNWIDEKGKSVLEYAIEFRINYHIIEQLIDFGATINFRQKTKENYLFDAAKCGDSLLARTLLALGADCDAIDKNRSRPIHLSVYACNYECIKCIIAAGCNVNSVDGNNDTPLYIIDNYDLENDFYDKKSKIRSKIRDLLIRNGANDEIDDEVELDESYYFSDTDEDDEIIYTDEYEECDDEDN